MTKKLLYLTILFWAYFLVRCDSTTNSSNKKNIQNIDTTKSFKIDNIWVTPNSSYDVNSLLHHSADTLEIVTCSEFVYSPFGIIKNADLKSGLLSKFDVIDTSFGMDGDEWFLVCELLKLNSNRILFYFHDTSLAIKHSPIIEGEVNDSSVSFSNNIKVGISLEYFYKIFFDNFPLELQNKYSVIVLESCVKGVRGIRHIYTFKDNKLYSIKFFQSGHASYDYLGGGKSV